MTASQNPSPSRPPWYVEFFTSPDSLTLGAFPDDETSRWEAEQIADLLSLQPGQTLIDVPCGPGRHLVHWARCGCRCFGVDLSPTMLAMAARRAAESNARLWLIRARMERLPFRSEIADAVVNLFNSFGYLSDEDNVRTVREAARVLKPGALFLLDTRNPVMQILSAPYGEVTELPDARVFVSRASYDPTSRRLHVQWQQLNGPQHYHASIRLYSVEELRDIFASANLQVEGIFGDFTGQPFEGDHYQLILLGRKMPTST